MDALLCSLTHSLYCASRILTSEYNKYTTQI
nr:MAG TPA_asm: hypothetical protein [Caudoviricetes sp.]